mgnify:FL=1
MSVQNLDKIFAITREQSISWRTFLDEVYALARVLPNATYQINLATQRYPFAVGFLAAVLRNQVVLLPPDQTQNTRHRLKAHYTASYEYYGPEEKRAHLSSDSTPPFIQSFTEIKADQVAAIPFTSGSTGNPVGHPKTWGHLEGCAHRIAQSLALPDKTTILATVPVQHMYGFELAILLPLFGHAVLTTNRPFYPSDIVEEINAAQGPLCLVTTPIHIRALIDSTLVAKPPVRIVSATEPLALEQAKECENRFKTKLVELYGCTEAGSMASRIPTRQSLWRWFDGILVREDEQGVIIESTYFSGDRRIQDHLDLHLDGQFEIRGRNVDMINIGGKRTSLLSLNHLLHQYPGILGGTFLQLEDANRIRNRLVAIVEGPGIDIDGLDRYLRNHLDPVFVPKRLIKLDQLPRTQTGKVQRQVLQEIVQNIEKS